MFATALFVGWAGAAHAQEPADPIDACVDGYERGQLAERRGKFLEARDQLARCMAAACPGKLKSECAPLLEDVRVRTPSVILVCAEPTADLASAGEVLVDDRQRPVDGRAFELDPGEHVFRLQSASAPQTFHRVVIEGAKGQRVAFACHGSSPVPKEPSPNEPSPNASSSVAPSAQPVALTVALASVAALGLGTFAYFGADGLVQRAKLDDCRGRCSDSEVDAVERRFLIADIGLGVTVLAGVAAGLVWWTHSTPSAKTRASRPVGPQWSF